MAVEISARTLAQPIQAGLDFLRLQQLPDGEFGILISDHADLRDGEPIASPFAAALILHSLHPARTVADGHMLGRALDFLEREADPPGVWPFWSRRSSFRQIFPPDVDDTCCASHALGLYGRRVPENRQTLLANRDATGRFYTWLAPRAGCSESYVPGPEALLWLTMYDQWNDIDVVVNVNALLYLRDSPDTSGAATSVRECVEHDDWRSHSNSYSDALVFYYMLARGCGAGVSSLAPLAHIVVERACGALSAAALDAALVANILLTFEPTRASLRSAIGAILASQQADGSWPAARVFSGANKHYGSAELTTGFCIEALSRFERREI